MEDLSTILRQLQEDQQNIEARFQSREQKLREELSEVQSEQPDGYEERQREIESQLARYEKLRRAVLKRYADLEQEARRRYPDYPEHQKKLEHELRIAAVLKLKELYNRSDDWVVSIGKLEIRWQRFSGYYPCPICGENVTLGWAIVISEDGPALEIKDYLFHYLEADHPVSYQIYWSAITPISLGFYISGPFSTITLTPEEETKHHCRHWLTDDDELLVLISMLKGI